jgi:membrane protein implicated in regulation of membrane protease activity
MSELDHPFHGPWDQPRPHDCNYSEEIVALESPEPAAVVPPGELYRRETDPLASDEAVALEPSSPAAALLSDGGLARVRSEAASAEQRASFLAALALLGLSDSVRSAFSISHLLRLHGPETFSLAVALGAALVAVIAFLLCGLAGTATLLDRDHLRLVRAAMLGRLSRARERIGERALEQASQRGRGETTKVLEAKLVAGLRCTGWFLVGGSAWIVSKVFGA